MAAGQNTADLAVTAVNLNTATVKDGAGNAANLTGAVTNPAGTLQIDTTAPTITAIAESPSSGDLNAGKRGHADAQPERGGDGCGRHADADAQRRRHRDLYGRLGHQCADLQLHGAAGQNTPDLTVTAVNLNAATIKDGAGNAANLSLSGMTQGSPQIDTTAPTVSSVTSHRRAAT